MDSQKPAVEWCLFSGNHGNRCLVQMDITNQVPVLTASYLSLRISVNVQCQNEFHLGHFLNRSKWKDWKKNEKQTMWRKETAKGVWKWGRRRWKFIVFIRLHDTAHLLRVALQWGEVVRDALFCSVLLCSALVLHFFFVLFWSTWID